MTQAKRQHHQACRRVSILGATGSIGTSTLDVLNQHPERFEIVALTAQDNVEKLAQLARAHRPRIVAIGNDAHATTLKAMLAGTGITVLAGAEGLIEAASQPVEVAVAAIVGAAGLAPTLAATQSARQVALANKESMVCAGPLVRASCIKHGTQLLPIDSEHNAIFQVLVTEHRDAVEKITLTASGGPFLQRALDSFTQITPEEAVAHPRWNMGAKISVDSATMMNKGLELIEAHYLFDLMPEQLDVLIHPESIIHSLVHYADGSVLAQLGMPDMRIPISYTLDWPNRLPITAPRLDLAAIASLHFSHAESARYPALKLARQAMKAGPGAMIALNAANEVAVAAFLDKKIRFPSITNIVERTLAKTDLAPISTLDAILAADAAARRHATSFAGASLI